MARISTYSLDEQITGGDKWIGSDSGFYNKTKNFTPIRLADYFNSSESINSSNSITFRYQTLDPLESRSFGTFSFESTNPPSIGFDNIQSLIVSKKSAGNVFVSDFLSSLGDSKILIHKAGTINEYGLYILNSVQEFLDDLNFLVFNLTFIQGNASLLEDEYYLLSVIDFSLNQSNDKNYIHTQDVPSSTWVVNHNLNKIPSVTITLPSGQVGISDVVHIDNNNLEVKFAGEETGKAILN